MEPFWQRQTCARAVVAWLFTVSTLRGTTMLGLDFMHSKNIQSTRTWTRLFTYIFYLYIYTIKTWTTSTIWTIWTNHLAGNLIPACTFWVIALLRIRMHVGFSVTRPNWWPSTMPPQGLESVQAELPRLRWLQWPLPPQWSRAWRPPHQPLRRWQWAMLPSKRKSMRSWWRKSAKWPVQLDKVHLISSWFWGLPCLDYIHNRHCGNPSNQQNGMGWRLGCFFQRSPVGLNWISDLFASWWLLSDLYVFYCTRQYVK